MLKFFAVLLLAALPWGAAGSAVMAQDRWPEDVEKALVQAGGNRSNLEKVLIHFKSDQDAEKFKAACFLIKNMPGHGFAQFALYDPDGNEIPFDTLKYKSFGDAKKKLAELESKHGKLKFKRKAFVEDLKTLASDFLIKDIESAFDTWRSNPWNQAMSFDTFCEYILPYRATGEPAEFWRDDCKIESTRIVKQMKNAGDSREAAGQIGRLTGRRVYFKKLYYLHPTDQGFKQLCDKPFGRCEDQQTMQTYVMRANGIAVAGDYTPHWANRDNNHAWDVILDKDGRGGAGLSHRAAKVYRKMYSHNKENLFFENNGREKIPKWLSGRTFRDVTEQYIQTSDVKVELVDTPPRETRYAYICVFNGGEWRPIHWALVDGKQATFANMGRNIAYLVAYYVDELIVPAAPPFILAADGTMTALLPDAETLDKLKKIEATGDSRDESEKAKSSVDSPSSQSGSQLYVWNREWREWGTGSFDPGDPALYSKLPAGGLYWLVSDANRETARIFTVENEKPRYW